MFSINQLGSCSQERWKLLPVFLKECKYIEKKVIRYINDDMMDFSVSDENKLGWPKFLQQKNVSHLSFKQKSMMYFSRTIFTISGYKTWVCKLTKYVHKFFLYLLIIVFTMLICL